MTAVDHAELKRVAEGATPGEWRVSEDNNPFADGRHVFAKGLDGTDFVVLNLKTDQTFVTATSRVQQQRNAKFSAAANPAVILELLSEIEGLKAELEQARAGRKLISSGAMDLGVMYASANERAAEAERQLAALRTQAPDSWRPDREAVMAIIDANKYEPWTVDRAGQMADAILAVRPQDEAMTSAFVPIDGQCFTSEQDWINRATRVLTGHAHYNNTEHGDASGWRGPHFTALSFDQAGRRVRNGADFKRATVEGTYPVWWIWPDQIVPALRPQTAESGK